MKKAIIFSLFLLTAVCILPTHLMAKTGYVSDMLLLTFREGPGTGYPVIKTLKSATRITIMEEQEGYFKVALESGETGWVDKKFIIFETPKAVVINGLNRQIKTHEATIADLKATIGRLQDQFSNSKDGNLRQISQLKTDLNTALKEKDRLAQSLSQTESQYKTLIQQSRNIQDIVSENKTLKEKNKSLETRLSTVESKNKTLLKTGMIKWFLAGVGTLFLGWIIGQSVTSRRRSGSSLLS